MSHYKLVYVTKFVLIKQKLFCVFMLTYVERQLGKVLPNPTRYTSSAWSNVSRG